MTKGHTMKLLQVYANAICAQADLLASDTDINRDRAHLKKMLRTLEEYTRKYKQELAVTIVGQ